MNYTITKDFKTKFNPPTYKKKLTCTVKTQLTNTLDQQPVPYPEPKIQSAAKLDHKKLNEKKK